MSFLQQDTIQPFAVIISKLSQCISMVIHYELLHIFSTPAYQHTSYSPGHGKSDLRALQLFRRHGSCRQGLQPGLRHRPNGLAPRHQSVFGCRRRLGSGKRHQNGTETRLPGVPWPPTGRRGQGLPPPAWHAWRWGGACEISSRIISLVLGHGVWLTSCWLLGHRFHHTLPVPFVSPMRCLHLGSSSVSVSRLLQLNMHQQPIHKADPKTLPSCSSLPRGDLDLRPHTVKSSPNSERF